MYVAALYIFVQENDVWLGSIAHLAHILVGKHCQLLFRGIVIKQRIERYMQYRLIRVLVCQKVFPEAVDGILHIHIGAVGRISNHSIPRYYTRGPVIHLLPVICECPVERNAPVDFRHHVSPGDGCQDTSPCTR